MDFRITSPAFPSGGTIPSVHTCEGADRSPPLAWSGVPTDAKTLALVVDDPDAPDPRAPRMTWVHWVLYDIPAATPGLPEAVPPGELPPGTREGKSDSRRSGWSGPCPPVGRHRYFFRLYALDRDLGDLHRPTKATLLEAMAGHVVGQAELMGTYQKGDR